MFGMAGLGFRKPTDEEKQYGNFNRRMFAATLDFALIGLFIAPLLDKLFVMYYGITPFDWPATQAQISAAQTEAEKVRIFREQLIESGALDRWMQNATMQFSVLLALIGICWHFWAATPGKMIMRMKIVDAKTRKPISDIQILLRLSGYVMSAMFFLLGFFWIGIDKKKQGWHDKLADTVVIALPWKKIKSDSKAAGQ